MAFINPHIIAEEERGPFRAQRDRLGPIVHPAAEAEQVGDGHNVEGAHGPIQHVENEQNLVQVQDEQVLAGVEQFEEENNGVDDDQLDGVNNQIDNNNNVEPVEDEHIVKAEQDAILVVQYSFSFFEFLRKYSKGFELYSNLIS